MSAAPEHEGNPRYSKEDAREIEKIADQCGVSHTVEDVLALEEIDFSDWSSPRLYDTVVQCFHEISRREGKSIVQVVSECAQGVAQAAWLSR